MSRAHNTECHGLSASRDDLLPEYGHFLRRQLNAAL
jgi:hypothetical protein